MKAIDGKNVVCRTSDTVAATAVPEFVGMKLPTAFMINQGAHGYGKFIYDEQTLLSFQSKLSLLEDNLDRK